MFRLKSVCSATETSWKIEISLEAGIDVMLSNKVISKGADQTARMGRLVCDIVVLKPQRQFFCTEDKMTFILSQAMSNN